MKRPCSRRSRTQISAARSQPVLPRHHAPDGQQGHGDRTARPLSEGPHRRDRDDRRSADRRIDVRTERLERGDGQSPRAVQRQATHVTRPTTRKDSRRHRPVHPAAGEACGDRRAEGHRPAPSPGPEPVARQHFTRSADQGHGPALHRRLSVTGLTSNPTIFEQAIKNSASYDAAITAGLATGRTRKRCSSISRSKT